ncbi:MAG: hypothetical protein NC305_12640 [Lachnospiraceae bacterium]|nr:hypothetical protein [Muribaculaceae bacterium]MCM1411380.1 hypothetical protein [Lachnospiraceae bacterium]
MNSKIDSTKMFSYLIGAFPLLTVYTSPLPGFDLATFLLMIFMIYQAAVVGKIRVADRIPMAWWFLYVALMSGISFLVQMVIPAGFPVSMGAEIPRFCKFLLFIGGVTVLAYAGRFSIEECLKAVRAIVHLSFWIVILQQGVWLIFRYEITNPLMILYHHPEYMQAARVSGSFLRPAALFYEPSHLSQYCLIYLCFVLFGYKERLQMPELIKTLLTIFLTGSGIGIMGAAAMVAYWALTSRRMTIKRLMIIVGGLVAVACILNTDYFQFVLARIFTKNIAYGGNAVVARWGKGIDFWLELPAIYKLIGTGFGNVNPSGYINGFGCMLNGTGLMGTAVFYAMVCATIRRCGSRWRKLLLLSYVVLMFGSSNFYVNDFVIYLLMSGCYMSTGIRNRVRSAEY